MNLPPKRKSGTKNLAIESIWWPDGEKEPNSSTETQEDEDISSIEAFSSPSTSKEWLQDVNPQMPSDKRQSISKRLKRKHGKSTIGRIKNWGKRSKILLEDKYLKPSDGDNLVEAIEGLFITPCDSPSVSSLNSFIFPHQEICFPITLPPEPTNLTANQIKRRRIFNALLDSENNYQNSLQRIIKDYKLPLEAHNILKPDKTEIIFYKVEAIFKHHLLVRQDLLQTARNWDIEEKIGDLFVSLIAEEEVLMLYSDFINHYTSAKDFVNQESIRNISFANFLKEKETENKDRMSLFDLMIQIVQRFPRYILLIQDLLNETSDSHPDRVSLQHALTTIESAANFLNERMKNIDKYSTLTKRIKDKSKRKLSAARDSMLITTSDFFLIGVSFPSYVIENSPFS